MSTSRFFRHLPLGMNRRNTLIRARNETRNLRRVKDKSGFKQVLRANGIATPETIELIHDFSDLAAIHALPVEFVIKPNAGFGGHGIILLERRDIHFFDPSGGIYTENSLKRHIRRILDGEFSGFIARELAIIEERVYPSEILRFRNALGLPDTRIFCFDFEPVMAMLRYPTVKSKGKSNLTAGGIGIALHIRSGTPTFIHIKGSAAEPKPEDIGMPRDFVMPQWEEMKDVASRASRLAGLALTGVDIILDSSDHVLVLEVNGRPGLEIQNINEDSLLEKFRRGTGE